jgi:dihydroneopterin aldolase
METIIISDLEIRMHIGVTEEERNSSQRVLITAEMEPATQREIGDKLENTIDYSAVRQGIGALLKADRFNLIETVAEVTARYILDEFRTRKVTVTVKKFPYDDTAFVAYRLSLGGAD